MGWVVVVIRVMMGRVMRAIVKVRMNECKDRWIFELIYVCVIWTYFSLYKFI